MVDPAPATVAVKKTDPRGAPLAAVPAAVQGAPDPPQILRRLSPAPGLRGRLHIVELLFLSCLIPAYPYFRPLERSLRLRKLLPPLRQLGPVPLHKVH